MLDPRALPALKRLEGAWTYPIPYMSIRRPAPWRIAKALAGMWGAAHFKNLFLANRAGTAFYLVLIRADKKFHTGAVSRQLGVERLSFGTPEQLEELLGLQPGAVDPFGADERPGPPGTGGH